MRSPHVLPESQLDADSGIFNNGFQEKLIKRQKNPATIRLPVSFQTSEEIVQIRLFVRLRGHSQIRFDCLEAFWKFTFQLLGISNRRHDDDIITILPVGRGRHAVVFRQLQ